MERNLAGSAAHLTADRLGAELDAQEQAHVRACVQCRCAHQLQVGRPARTPRDPAQLGRYRVLGLVGSGGMARVLAVVDPDTGERRAVKVMQLPSAALRARFVREARLQRRVVHPNVLPILEVIEVAGHPALVLPLVEGPSLAQLLERAPPALDQRLALFREIVAGVAALHGAGMVHRDLKPANLLLDAGGETLGVRVSDFGLAKVLGADPQSVLTHTGAAFGTPPYMAPEQRADAARVDARADVWALGVILFELLMGRRPHSPTEQAGGPEAWGTLARKLRAFEPALRPSDAVQILAVLPGTVPFAPGLLETCRSLAPVPVEIDWTVTTGVPVADIPHNLPAERDAFVGREAELVELAGLITGGARLVSVVGFGGMGKTRLLVRYGWLWLDDYPGGVWFCDLSEARGVEGVVYAVARGLDVPLGQDPVVQLGHAIAGRGRCLVLLDNFEQVARFAAETLGKWLDRASTASFVVSTREILGLPGEVAMGLDPLLPVDGVSLFLARAQAADPDFVLVDDARPHVDTLVKLLDGLPLAIELAAAPIRVMSPWVLLERMSHRFKLLSSPGGRPWRQATLRATLDWSWELLSTDEQRALAQVSVFEGGFTLEAAEAVLSLEEAWPMDAVQSLVDKSLIRRVAEDRFDLLVSVQEYAAERLDLAGARADTEARHGRHYAAHGTDEAIDSLDRHGGVERRRALLSDLENLVVAPRRGVRRGDGEVAASTLQAAWAVLEMRGPLVVAADLAADVLGLSSLPPRARSAVENVLGAALDRLGRGAEAQTHFGVALATARASADRRQEGLALANLGSLHRNQGRMDEARAHFDAALAVHREVGNRGAEGFVLGELGILHLEQDRMDEARAHFDTALAVHREVGDRRNEGTMIGNLGFLHKEQGRMEEAQAHHDAALAVHREVGDRRSEGLVLNNLAVLHKEQGRMDEARAHYDAALVVLREVGDRRGEGWVLGNLGLLHNEQGRMDEALAHYDTALVVLREVGDRRGEGFVLDSLGKLHLRQGRTAEARVCFEAGEILLRGIGNKFGLANVLCGRSQLEQAEGRLEAALAALTEAEALAVDLRNAEVDRELAKARVAVHGPR